MSCFGPELRVAVLAELADALNQRLAAVGVADPGGLAQTAATFTTSGSDVGREARLPMPSVIHAAIHAAKCTNLQQGGKIRNVLNKP